MITKKNNFVTYAIYIASLANYSVWAADTSVRYVNCMDYNTVGSGLCRPDDPVPEGPQRADAPKKDPVQEFLDNHGKPPREFAEFYVNPTPENAQKWNQAFRAQQLRAAQISSAWKAAIEQEQASVSSTVQQSLARPAVVSAPALQNSAQNRGSLGAAGVPSSTIRFGAFATADNAQGSITYYFSVSDPNSAKMSANLGAIYNGEKSKYKFTCVDLTPLSDKFQASPANRGGMPCDWRMPRAGEIESLKIQQTPVLIIQRPNTQPQQFAGVVEQQKLLELLR